MNNIIIFSDNKIILNLIKLHSFPKYEHIRFIIDKIFNYCNQIKLKKLCNNIIFKKIKSHHSTENIYYGNYIADKFANIAQKNAKYDYKSFSNITFNSQLTQIYAIINKRIKDSWIKTVQYHKINNNNKLIYQNIPKYNNKLYQLFKHLTIHESSIIIKLILEIIELNYYMFKYDYRRKEEKKLNKISPLCSFCKKNESINHFFFDCKISLIKQARFILFNNIDQINQTNKTRITYSKLHFIFPFNYFNNNISILIWREITKFVNNTKRFDENQNQTLISI